jgi:hypothetical protein
LDDTESLDGVLNADFAVDMLTYDVFELTNGVWAANPALKREWYPFAR